MGRPAVALGAAAGGSGLREHERKYTEVFFAGSEKFPTKEVVRGVQVAAAEGGPTRYTAMWVASLNGDVDRTGWSTMATAWSGCRPGPTL